MACCSDKRAGLEEVEEEICDDCTTWEEKLYWKRFQSLHFCQILDPASEFHKQLVIPKKFAKNARAILPPEVALRGPSGASWYVIMTMSGDDVFLSDGWEEFVRAYSLQAGNILIFKYDGISVFDVLIFDGENLCEKESTYFVQKCEHVNPSSERQRKRNSSKADMEEHNDNHINRATKQARKEVGKKSVKMTPKRSKFSSFYGRSRRKQCVPRKSVPSKGAPSNQEPQNAAELDGTCATEAPDESNARGTFSTEPLPQDVPRINGSWLIEVEDPPQSAPQINGSFYTEALPQNGKGTDGRCPNEATPQKIVSARGRPKRALSSGKQEASVPSGRMQTKTSSKKVTSSVGRLKKQLGATKAAEGSPFDSSKRFHVSERGKVALDMARKQMTESSFVAVMRPTSVYRGYIVSVPAEWYKKYLSPNSQGMLLRLEDKTWLTRLYYNTSKGTGSICGGWKQFVQENQLEEFDVCLFDFASKKDDLVMMDVSIFRADTMDTP